MLMGIVEDREPEHAGIALWDFEVVLRATYVGHIFVLRYSATEYYAGFLCNIHEHCVKHNATYIVEKEVDAIGC